MRGDMNAYCMFCSMFIDSKRERLIGWCIFVATVFANVLTEISRSKPGSFLFPILPSRLSLN